MSSLPFQTTLWAPLKAALTDPIARDAMLASYLPALRLYLRRRFHSLDHDRIDDHLQDFLVHTEWLSKLVSAADPERGRFRALVARAATNFVLDKLRARKHESYPLADDQPDLSPPPDDPDKLFEASWAESAVRDAVEALFQHCKEAAERHRTWNVFRARYLEEQPLSGNEIAERFGLTRSQVDCAARSARAWFRRRLIVLLKQQTSSLPEQEAALGELFEVIYQNDKSGRWRLTSLPYLAEAAERASWHIFAMPGPDVALAPATLMEESLVEERLFDLLMRPLAPEMRPLGDLLAHPTPPLDDLRRIKAVARANGDRWAAKADDGRVGEAQLMLAVWRYVYYASLAAALVRHETRITSMNNERLREGFSWLIDLDWGDPVIADVCTQALGMVGQG